MNWFAVAGALGVLAVGAAGGYTTREVLGQQRIVRCANSIRDQTLSGCPVPIVTAFDAVKGDMKTTEIEYRDRVIPILSQGQLEALKNAQAQSADVADLGTVEKTNACADSPAFVRRREQLLRDQGSPDPVGSESSTPAG